MPTPSRSGIAALLVAHCAGMLDLVALPVWVGAALVGTYKLDPQQAGLLASLFLGGQVVSSMLLAPRFTRVPARQAAVGGFAIAGLSFLGVALTASYPLMALLHCIGGMGAGCALSVTHGCIGRSANPHRLFALAGFALALFGIFILGGGSKLVAGQGGAALFFLFAAVMTLACIVATASFPKLGGGSERLDGPNAPLPRAAWFCMVGIGLLALAQATMFSFVERVGVDRGFGAAVTAVLVAAGFVNLMPGPLAGWLQHKLRPEAVIVAGPLVHAAAVFAITHTDSFALYAPLVSVLIATTVFTHTFLFGLVARLDASGRAVAATPAMLMLGAAIGPVLGGTAVKLVGYPGLGVVAAAIGLCSSAMFACARARREDASISSQPA
ncbi:MFS transporter [Ramlibacter sp. CGMCC 1.13660]|nr:MFS transporter [Ramlibacter sp. CGMCC 1.13660]